MKRIKEYMKNMTKQGWITFIAVGLLLVIVIIGIIKYYNDQNSDAWSRTLLKNDARKSKQVNIKKTDKDFIQTATDAAFEKENAKVESLQNTQTEVSYAYKPEEVEIALIIEENQYDIKNIISGACGNVYMVTAYVPGPQVLTNSLKALFGDKVFGDFMPGNIIPSYHPNLNFKEVKIEKGVAKVYLGGSFSGSRNGVCDATLAISQIKYTAKSYPNVTSVEIYQDGKKIN